MNVNARLRHSTVIKPDRILGSGYGYLYLKLCGEELLVYGNPVERLMLDVVLDTLSFETVLNCYKSVAKEFPNDYTRCRADATYILAQHIMPVLGGIAHQTQFVEWKYQVLGRADSRNAVWLREYALNRISELKEYLHD